MIWGRVLTQSNKLLPVEVGSVSDKAAKSRFSIGTVVVLACLGLALHVSVLLLVLQARRAADDRETDVRRREVAAESIEARRTGLLSEISAYENQIIDKRRKTDEASLKAADALKILSDRDRTAKELEEIKVVLDRTKAELNAATANLETVKRDENGIRQSLTDLKKEYASEDQRRGIMRTEILSLDRRIIELKAQATEAEGRADASRKIADDVARQRSEREAALNEVLTTLAQRTAISEGFKSQNESLRKEGESLRLTRDALKDEIGRLDKQKQDLNSEIKDLDQRREASRKEAAEVQMQLTDRKRQADEAAKVVESTARLRKEQEVALVKINDEIAKKSSELVGVNGQILLLRKDEALLQKMLDVLKTDLAASEKRQQVLNSEIKGLEQQSAVAGQASIAAEGRAAELKKRIEDAVKAEAKLNEDVAKLRMAEGLLQNKIDLLRPDAAAVDQAAIQRKQVEAELANKNAELAAIKKLVADEQAELSRIKYERSFIKVNADELVGIEKERAAAQKKLDQILEEMKRQVGQRPPNEPQ